MDHYYKTVFPAQSLHAFATRSAATANASFNADQREFGTEAVDGTFRRWKACSNPSELKKLVAQHGIGKLNMGAVYERPVSMRFKLPSTESMKPIGRELIIDVDLTDYSHFAVPKDDLELNDKMFTVVGIAIELLKDVLEQNFGFKDFLAVYSGRRGAHLYVLDQRAFDLAEEARRAIASFFSPPYRTFHPSKRLAFRFLVDVWPSSSTFGRNSPFTTRLMEFFEDVGLRSSRDGGLGILDSKFQREAFLGMCEVSFFLSKFDMSMIFARATCGLDCYKMIVAAVSRVEDEAKREGAELKILETVLTYLFPRIDSAVTSGMGHMLKAPYSVHPSTKRVSTPFFGCMTEFCPSKHSFCVDSWDDETNARFAKNVCEFDSFCKRVYVSPSPSGGSKKQRVC